MLTVLTRTVPFVSGDCPVLVEAHPVPEILEAAASLYDANEASSSFSSCLRHGGIHISGGGAPTALRS